MGDEVYEVPNALEDDLFVDNPLVTGNPYLRFYAGAPLKDSDKNKEKVLELNVAGFIHKPLDKNKLKEVFSVINEYLSIIVFPRNSV